MNLPGNDGQGGSAPRLQRRTLSRGNRFGRLLWNAVWLLLFRPSPVFMHEWRRLLLRLFGARIGRHAHVYPSARIWAPWNLEMGEHSAIAPNVDCYCVDKVVIGMCSTVSQYSYLCTASHDYRDPAILEGPDMPLVTAPITLADRVWITAGVFIGPGVQVGQGTVVLARSCVTQDLPSWSVVSGHPAKVLRPRTLKTAAARLSSESASR